MIRIFYRNYNIIPFIDKIITENCNLQNSYKDRLIISSDKTYRDDNFSARYIVVDGLANYVFYYLNEDNLSNLCGNKDILDYFHLVDNAHISGMTNILYGKSYGNDNPVNILRTIPINQSVKNIINLRIKVLRITKPFMQLHELNIQSPSLPKDTVNKSILEKLFEERFIITDDLRYSDDSFCDIENVLALNQFSSFNVIYHRHEGQTNDKFGIFYFDPECKIINNDISERVKANIDFFDIIYIDEEVLPGDNASFYITINNLSKYDKIKIKNLDSSRTRIPNFNFRNFTVCYPNNLVEKLEDFNTSSVNIYKITHEQNQLKPNMNIKLMELLGIEDQTKEIEKLSSLNEYLNNHNISLVNQLLKTQQELALANTEIASLKTVTSKLAELAKMI